MAKCEAIDLTLSVGAFIQAKKTIHLFLYQALYTTSSFCYIKFLLQWKYFTGFVHVFSNYCIEALINIRTLKKRCALVARIEVKQTQEL